MMAFNLKVVNLNLTVSQSFLRAEPPLKNAKRTSRMEEQVEFIIICFLVVVLFMFLVSEA